MQVLRWTHRSEALTPAGMVTSGQATGRLLARLRALDAPDLSRLSVVATRDMLVLLGSAADLPWVNGARYCAPDPATQSLWMPTNMAPALPADLLRRSARARAGEGALLLWPAPELFMPLDGARSLTPALRGWLAEQGA